jgi:hypothetical protein
VVPPVAPARGSGPRRGSTILAADSAAPSTTNTVRTPLSPASYTRQLYQEARALPCRARAERRENLFLELAALAAADREEKEAEDEGEDEE